MKSNNGIGYICISWRCTQLVEVMNSRCTQCPLEDIEFEMKHGLYLYYDEDNPLTHKPRDRTKDREQVKENSNGDLPT